MSPWRRKYWLGGAVLGALSLEVAMAASDTSSGAEGAPLALTLLALALAGIVHYIRAPQKLASSKVEYSIKNPDDSESTAEEPGCAELRREEKERLENENTDLAGLLQTMPDELGQPERSSPDAAGFRAKMEEIEARHKAEMRAILEEARSVLDASAAMKAEAELSEENARMFLARIDDMIKAYREGLPDFVVEPAEGARFGKFLDLIVYAKLNHPECVDPADELDIQLRAFAIKQRRENNHIERIACVHEIGKRLYNLMQSLNFTNDEQWREADIWAQALNKVGRQTFRIFVPNVGEQFDAELMRGGAPNYPVRTVWSWGVKNARDTVLERAGVS